MKKIISLALVLVIITSAAAFSGCSQNGESAQPQSEKSLKIVATIFPEYDWIMNILGEKADGADVTLLLDKGVDLHSYQPTADDIIKLSSCDLFVYVGGESDEWVEDALKEATNKNMAVLDLLETLGDTVREEEIVEGMEEEPGEEEEGIEYDEHIWLSLRCASQAVKKISEEIIKLDPENADVYKANTDSYMKKLDELDADFAAAVKTAKLKTVLFADRFPFRYFVDDYGIEYFAAFAGCSAESEASFETVAALAKKVDSIGLKNVLTLEGSDGKIAETVISTADSDDVSVLKVDSMQSVTAEDIKNGATYLGITEKNLGVFRTALGCGEV